MSFSSARDTPAFATIIDGNGQVTDFLRLQDMTKRRNAWRPKDKEAKVLKKILYSPNQTCFYKFLLC